MRRFDNNKLAPRSELTDNNKLALTADCENCTPGSFCDGIDPSDVTGVCEAGFYCPGGSTKASDVICTVGSYCTEGKSLPTFSSTNPAGGVQGKVTIACRQ